MDVTGTSGQFTTTLTETTPGHYSVSASAGIATASTTVNVVASTPATIALNVPSTIEVGQSFTIRASAVDQYGNPVANGTPITISSSDSKDIPTVTLDTQNGQVQDPISKGITAVGIVNVSATSGKVSASSSIQATPGAPESVTIVANPTTITAGQSVTFSGQVYGPDQTPPATGTPVKLTSTSDTQDPLPTTSTNAKGQYSIGATLTLAGTQQITAQVPSNGSTITSQSVAVTVQPGPAEQIINFTASPDPVEQGATTTLTGTLEDAYGNLEPADVPVTISGAGLSKTLTTVTKSGGTFAVSGNFTAAGTQTVTAESNGTPLTGGTLGVQVLPTGSYALSANPATTSITAGQSATIVWTLVNSQGQPVPNAPISFSLNPNVSNAITPTSGTTNSQGQISVTVGPLTQAQNYTLDATDTATTNVSGSMAITVSAGAPYTVDPPSISPSIAQSTEYGGTTYPTISGILLDRYGNPIANANVTVTGGWSSSAATEVTNSQGYFDLSLSPVNVGGPYYPTISATDSAGTYSQTYTNTSLTVVKSVYDLTLTPISGSTNALVGTPYGVIATLTQNGSSVNGVSVTFTAATDATATMANLYPSGPTGSATQSLVQNTGTYQSGQAAVNVTLDQTGSQTIVVSYQGITAQLVVNASAPQINQLIWTNVNPNPVTAGQSVTVQGTLLSENGVPTGGGDTIKVQATGPSTASAVGSVQSNGTFSVTFSPSSGNGLTTAGTYTLSAQDVSQSSPFFVSAIGPGSVTVIPGPVQFLYPVLGPVNNASGTLLPGGSWNSSTNTMSYGTLPASDGSTVSTRWTAYDAYGNAVPNWSTGTVTCTASNGGACPTITQPSEPTNSSGNSGWANEGSFPAGTYTLTYTPSGSDLASAAQSSTATFTLSNAGLFLSNTNTNSSIQLFNTNANPWGVNNTSISLPSTPVTEAMGHLYTVGTTNGTPDVQEWNGANWVADTALNNVLASLGSAPVLLAGNRTSLYAATLYWSVVPGSSSMLEPLAAAAVQSSSSVSALSTATGHNQVLSPSAEGFYSYMVTGQPQLTGSTMTVDDAIISNGPIYAADLSVSSSGTITLNQPDVWPSNDWTFIPLNQGGTVATGIADKLIPASSGGTELGIAPAWDIRGTVTVSSVDDYFAWENDTTQMPPDAMLLPFAANTTNAWFIGPSGNHLYQITQNTGSILTVPLPSPMPPAPYMNGNGGPNLGTSDTSLWSALLTTQQHDSRVQALDETVTWSKTGTSGHYTWWANGSLVGVADNNGTISTWSDPNNLYESEVSSWSPYPGWLTQSP